MNGAAFCIERERTLPRALEPANHVVSITQRKLSGIDEHAAVLLRLDRETCKNAARERVFDRAALELVVRRGAECDVPLHQKHLVPAAQKMHEPARADLPAIKTDV